MKIEGLSEPRKTRDSDLGRPEETEDDTLSVESASLSMIIEATEKEESATPNVEDTEKTTIEHNSNRRKTYKVIARKS